MLPARGRSVSAWRGDVSGRRGCVSMSSRWPIHVAWRRKVARSTWRHIRMAWRYIPVARRHISMAWGHIFLAWGYVPPTWRGAIHVASTGGIAGASTAWGRAAPVAARCWSPLRRRCQYNYQPFQATAARHCKIYLPLWWASTLVDGQCESVAICASARFAGALACIDGCPFVPPFCALKGIRA